MKNVFGIILVFCCITLFTACGSNNASNHDYVGTFSIVDGITFQLNADSTATIHFDQNGEDYNSTWKIVREGDSEWANIEFAGNQEFYYLKGGKLYRSHANMDLDYLGWEVTYQD